MGLSATQMRFLMVTARKSNVEYQGQQVNQARTDLANQSSALYTELLQLKAPTAPSKYTYIISPTTTPIIDWSDDNSYPLSGDAAIQFMVHYAGNEPNFLEFNIPVYTKESYEDANGDIQYRYLVGHQEDENKTPIYKTEEELTGTTYAYRAKGKDSAGNDASYVGMHVNENEFYYYDNMTGMFTVNKGAMKSDGETPYSATDFPKWIQAYNAAMSCYQTYSKPTSKAIYTQEGYDKLQQDGLTEEAKQNMADAFNLTAKTSYNDAQYAAALEQYEQDLAEYEKAYAEINKKTEEIHEADKKLELQLKQLDTEQEAIQTEYEALKKVLDKNIENTFKTFG